jgi:UDP-glucuronate 4-epimerase
MKILITGCAGFIGFHVTKYFLDKGYYVLGLDNLNSYYDIKLKNDRLNILKKSNNKKFTFLKVDISDKKKIDLLKKYEIDVIVHLAAQAGVRYSLEQPHQYIQSNILGFFNIINFAKIKKIKKIIYASSSSIYGNINKSVFSENLITNKPIQLYAATKSSNELMAATYNYLYKISFVGLRFFTVYGEWGRPDMAIYNFTRKIKNNEYVELYNYGNNFRDFTYIDDVVLAVAKTLNFILKKNKINEIFNIGNSKSISVRRYLKEIEKNLEIKAKYKLVEPQMGDMTKTKANIKKAAKLLKWKPKISLDEGIRNYVNWFNTYY